MTHSRIEENKDIYDFELDKEDLGKLHTKEYSPSAWVSIGHSQIVVMIRWLTARLGSDEEPTQSVVRLSGLRMMTDRSIGGGMPLQFVYGHMKTYFTKYLIGTRS